MKGKNILAIAGIGTAIWYFFFRDRPVTALVTDTCTNSYPMSCVGVYALHKGELFSIDIYDSPSTGFSWNYQITEGYLETGPYAQISLIKTDIYSNEDRTLPGSGYHKVYTFRADTIGSANIIFINSRGEERAYTDSYELYVGE